MEEFFAESVLRLSDNIKLHVVNVLFDGWERGGSVFEGIENEYSVTWEVNTWSL